MSRLINRLINKLINKFKYKRRIKMGMNKCYKVAYLTEGNEDELKIAVVNDDGIREIIGGYIELAGMLNDHIAILCDEEGKLKGRKPTLFTPSDIIVGTVVFAAVVNGGDFGDLNDEDIKFLEEYINW